VAEIRRFEAHPQSAPGDFYVVNHECISCGAPHVVAPDLIGWNNSEADHCIWKKQPETKQELQRAFAAFNACCVGCYRYAGNDPEIISRIGSDHCDQASLFPGLWSSAGIAAAPFQFTLSASQQTSFSSKFQGAAAAVVSFFMSRKKQ
jgi:ferredoxin-like protein FixX